MSGSHFDTFTIWLFHPLALVIQKSFLCLPAAVPYPLPLKANDINRVVYHCGGFTPVACGHALFVISLIGKLLHVNIVLRGKIQQYWWAAGGSTLVACMWACLVGC